MRTSYELLAEPHPGQREIHEHPARFKVLAAGRRWGKTRLGVFECLDTASKGGRAWWVAPTYKMANVGWRPIQRLGVQIGAEIRRADRQILLSNGGEVSVRSADNPDSLRGEGLDKVIMDECAFIAEAAWVESLRPALSDRLGSAVFYSTPSGRNWFWRLHQKGLNEADWHSWQLPTSNNPYIAPEEIEAARSMLPELIFQQEYLAEFLEHEGAVFRNILACLNAPLDPDPDDHKDHSKSMGVDWGKQSDFTSLSLGCEDCGVELDKDRFNQIDYIFQRGRLRAMYDKWGPNISILAESNAMGEPIIEQLQAEGLPVIGFNTSATTKPPLIENLALTFEREEFQFQDDPIWTGELEAYERIVSPATGRSQYSAPVGMNDDTVIARALMRWNMTSGGWYIS